MKYLVECKMIVERLVSESVKPKNYTCTIYKIKFLEFIQCCGQF